MNKLSFNGYFKFDKPLYEFTPVVVYCVMIIAQDEGGLYTGSVTFNNCKYGTLWLNNKSSYCTFDNYNNKEAILELFEVDWKDRQIGFFNNLVSERCSRDVAASYPKSFVKEILVNLESRSRDLVVIKPTTLNIDDVINNAHLLKPHWPYGVGI
jgi:hypothetical protein